MDLTRVDPIKLRHLIAVVDAGSFAGAAAAMRMSQPSISKSIRALEATTNAQLFDRGRAGARPTRYAELLVGHARAILAEYALAAAELHALSNANEQQLAIGAGLSLAQALLPKAIASFRRRWPETMLSVDVGFSLPLLTDLRSGQLDLVLCAPEDALGLEAGLIRTPLLEERDTLVVGAAHPLLSRTDFQLSDLLDCPWIVPRQSSRLDHIHAVFARHRLPPPSYMLRCESGDLARGLLREEPFICLMGEGVLQSDIQHGEVAVLPHHDFFASRAAFLFMRRGGHPRAVARNFADVVMSVAEQSNC